MTGARVLEVGRLEALIYQIAEVACGLLGVREERVARTRSLIDSHFGQKANLRKPVRESICVYMCICICLLIKTKILVL